VRRRKASRLVEFGAASGKSKVWGGEKVRCLKGGEETGSETRFELNEEGRLDGEKGGKVAPFGERRILNP